MVAAAMHLLAKTAPPKKVCHAFWLAIAAKSRAKLFFLSYLT